jgi:phosphoserine phosphatase
MKQLHVYDFDGTLYDSPASPDKNPVWWLYARSLDKAGAPGFDARWNVGLLIEARRSLQSAGVSAAVVTGRPDYKEMRDRIAQILHVAGLDFPMLCLKPLSMHSIPDYKAWIVGVMVDKDPLITKVVMYDDLQSNLDAVKRAMAYRKIKFEGHKIMPRSA